MVLVRIVFQTKWGKAQEVVDGLKRGSSVGRRILGRNVRGRILTDLSGPFHTVVQEFELESLAEWERNRAAMFADPEFQQSQAAIVDFLESGRGEFYTVEATFD